MDDLELFLRFGSALAIGLLVGMQREYSQGGRKQRLFAGVRTFPLLSLAGAGGGLLTDVTESPWPLVAVIIGMGALIVQAYAAHTRAGSMGATTEVAALLIVIAGAFCYFGYYSLAAALAVAMTGLLTLKVEMHGFVRSLDRDDLFAVLKFALITAVILPVLPNQDFGPEPLNVLNPYSIWLMVVLVSGIGFLGYVMIKALGPRQGLIISGLLGGLVSSTAVTASFSQRSRDEPELAVPMAMAIAVSWTTMFLRVLVVVGILHWPLLGLLWPPFLASTLVGLGYAALALRRASRVTTQEIAYDNPFQLTPALKFGLIYAVVLVVARAAQEYLGDAGVYLSSAAAGLVDLNAISLSLARMAVRGRVALELAAQGLVIAAVANTLVKGGIVLMGGAAALRRALWPVLALMVLAAAGVAALTI